MAFCAFHPRRIAIETCRHCRAAICDECKNILKGNHYCPKCASEFIPGVTLVPYRTPWHAALLSAIIPGLGQVYNGQLGRGLKFFIFSWLIIPWLYSIFDAYGTAVRINDRIIVTSPSVQDFAAFLCVGVIIFSTALQAIRYYHSDQSLFGAVPRELNMLGRAIERYHQDRQAFPENFSQLYFSQPPYIDEILCETERHGYQYACDFKPEGYTVTATPAEQRKNKPLPLYTLTTGGQLISQIF